MQLQEHGDFGRLLQEEKALHKEFGQEARPLALWRLHMANREFEEAAVLADSMDERQRYPLSRKLEAQILAYSFLQREDKLEKLLAKGAQSLLLGSNLRDSGNPELSAIKDLKLKITHKFDINLQSNGVIEWRFSRYWRALWSRKDLIMIEPMLLVTYFKAFCRKLKKRVW